MLAHPSPGRILIRGVGDIGSAVAHHLYQAGYAVIIHEGPYPTTSRRGMAFTDAIFDGRAQLMGVEAVRIDNLATVPAVLQRGASIPVVLGDLPTLLRIVEPEVVVDARMRKRAQPGAQRGWAALTIGLGPNFVAGETTDLAIETSWGSDLGRVIDQGPTLPLAGEPRAIDGHERDRFIYAPSEGMFRTSHQIGDLVQADDAVASIGSTVLYAPLTGALRGLTHDGVPVTQGTKVIEVDPRGTEAIVRGIPERPGRIAEGVVQAVRAWSKAKVVAG